MLDLRIYRAAFLPALVAIVVTAFSVREPPRPIGTTLSPDAFLGVRAYADLTGLAREFPDRRPGAPDDVALSAHVAHELRSSLKIPVRVRVVRGDTVDGKRDLMTVIATRPGAPGPGLLVLSHRDAAARGAVAELSGTAAMLELARVVADGRLHRTVTFVSTSGGSGGAAGAADVVGHLPGRVSAALVLGNLAGAHVRPPFVTAFSNGEGQAPLRLRRTVDAVLAAETGRSPGAPRALTQWARLAFPMTVGEQGELGRQGLAAVLVQASGERPPAAGEPLSAAGLESFGRAALRTIYALDNGPTLAGGPRAELSVRGKVLPLWTVYLLVGTLLLPAFIVTLDGLSRVRRRRHPVAMWLPWVATGALPFVLAGSLTMLLTWVGLIDAPGAPVPAEALVLDSAAKAGLAAVALVFALGWLLRPLALRRLMPQEPLSGSPGAAGALALTACAVTFVVYLVNPYAAALLIVPLHLWLVVSAPDLRLSRGTALALLVVGLVPLGLVVVADARTLGYDPLQLLWLGVLLTGGGHVSLLTWLTWSVVGACLAGAAAMALRIGAVRSAPTVAPAPEPRYVARAARARRPALWR
jgi:peptidase M28-like protein